MKESPRNKMIGAEDETIKAPVSVPQVREVRDEAAEVSGRRRFYFPHLGVSVEADTQEEAEIKARDITKETE